MKAKTYILLILLSVVSSCLRAQSLVSVDYMSDSVRVVYELPIDKVRSDYQLTYRPVITSKKGDTLRLEPVVLHGSSYIRQAHRDFVLNAPKGAVEQTYRPMNKVHSPLRDTVQVPVTGNEWLLTDTICLCYTTREKEGCCRLTDMGGQCGEVFAYAEPVVIPVFTEPVDTVKDTLIPIVPATPNRYLPRSIAGLSVQKQVPQVIRRINSGALRSLEDYRPYVSTEILAKDSDALLVFFELDKIELKEEYRDNKLILDSIIRLVGELMTDTMVEVKLVQIVGLASAEGPVSRNEWLAGERAKALEAYIRERYPEMTDQMFELNNGGEAWSELRYQIEQTEPFYGREEILSIIDNTADVNLREQRIKSLYRGVPYKYILDHILLDQRNSGYIRVYYDVTDDEARLINMSIRRLQDAAQTDGMADKQALINEALDMLRRVERDPRSWNAHGVALWMLSDMTTTAEQKNALRQEALNFFSRAADRGDTEAKRNIELLGE